MAIVFVTAEPGAVPSDFAGCPCLVESYDQEQLGAAVAAALQVGD